MSAPTSKPLGTITVSSASLAAAGLGGPVSIQLQGPAGLQGRLQQIQGQVQGQLVNIGVKQGQGDGQQEAISAIVQSLMRAETQFEAKKLEDSRKVPSSPSPSLPSPSPTPVLPTTPLPPTSLATRPAPRSLAGLLASPPPPVPVSSPGVSQLAAQLARPVAGGAPPSYSQAIRDQQTSSPRKRDTTAASPSPQDSNALSAMLADTPAADKPLPPGAQGVHGSNSNLLERLVSQSQHSGAGGQSSSNLAPAAGQLPSVHIGSSNGSGEEITLQSLLSNPGKAPGSLHSPGKHSPLLQQLQQPVRIYQGATAGLTSPRQPPASPRSSVTSPRGSASPRPPSALQQQLMQPPAPRYPSPVSGSHSILSAALSSNLTSPRSSHLQSSAPQVVSVSLAPPDQSALSATPVTSISNGHLMVQGVQAGFQLLPQAGLSHPQQLQLVQQGAGVGAAGVQLVQGAGGSHGQLQLVSQGLVQGGVQGQQFQVIHPGQQLQIVQNQAVPGQAVSFAVNGVTQAVGSRAAGTMAKLVSSPNGAGPTTVVLQQASAGNLLLPQQQQFSLKQGGQVMVQRQQVAGAGQVVVRPGGQQQGQVQLQQPFQVVQVPAGQIANHNQIIQIGRGMAVNNLVSVSKGSVVASPSPQGAPAPGLPCSPGAALPSDPPLVVQMEGAHPHFIQQPQIINNINNKPALNNQTQFKIRQQRKQSLK